MKQSHFLQIVSFGVKCVCLEWAIIQAKPDAKLARGEFLTHLHHVVDNCPDDILIVPALAGSR